MSSHWDFRARGIMCESASRCPTLLGEGHEILTCPFLHGGNVLRMMSQIGGVFVLGRDLEIIAGLLKGLSGYRLFRIIFGFYCQMIESEFIRVYPSLSGLLSHMCEKM